MMTKKEPTKIVNFMTPGAPGLGHGHKSHIVKMQYILKNLLLYTQAYCRSDKLSVK